jgi:hypothetical protein
MEIASFLKIISNLLHLNLIKSKLILFSNSEKLLINTFISKRTLFLYNTSIIFIQCVV